MAFTTSGKNALSYEITADPSKLKKGVQEAEASFTGLTKKVQSGAKSAASEVSNVVSALTGDRLTGAASQVTSLANAFGAIPGPAGLAVGAVASFGVAVVAVGGALFELTKQASEYGSTIHDASDKTGLHAETLSAMDVAAKQSGTSLDQVTNSIQKFAQTVGQAAEGSDKAKKSLIALGIDPKAAVQDLDGALGQVFKKIMDAKTPVEQNTLAFQAFGKQGKELLPFIKQFDGDLPGLIAKMKELGVTITDADAAAADEFGDQLTLLETQFERIGTKIGIALIPAINRLDAEFSDFLGRHQKEIESFVEIFAYFIETEIAGIEKVIDKARPWIEFFAKYNPAAMLGTFLGQTVGSDFLKQQRTTPGQGLGRGTTFPSGDLPDIYGKPDRAKRGKSAEQLAREAEAAERKRIEAIRKGVQEEIELKANANDVILARYRSDEQTGIIDEEQALQYRQALTRDFYIYKFGLLDQELKDVGANVEAQDRIRYESKILQSQYETELEKERGERAEAYNHILDKFIEKEQEEGKAIVSAAEAQRKLNEEFIERANILGNVFDQLYGNEQAPVSNKRDSFLDLFFNKTGMDVFQTNVDIVASNVQDLADIFANSFGAMTNAVAQSIETWELYGGSVGHAMKQATAAVLAQISAQALVKALYYTAEGIAALFLNPPAAGAFFTAAAIDFGIAAGAGLAAYGISDHGKGGAKGGSGGSYSYGGGSGGSSSNQTPVTYSRVSANAYQSGMNDHLDRLATAVDGLHHKIASMPAHAVVTIASQQKPGIIGHQVVKDISSNSSIGTNLQRASGNRR